MIYLKERRKKVLRAARRARRRGARKNQRQAVPLGTRKSTPSTNVTRRTPATEIEEHTPSRTQPKKCSNDHEEQQHNKSTEPKSNAAQNAQSMNTQSMNTQHQSKYTTPRGRRTLNNRASRKMRNNRVSPQSKYKFPWEIDSFG